MPVRFAELGDVHAGHGRSPLLLDALLELARRDEHDHGLGDLPYPPEYPKMRGSPSGCSRARRRRTLRDHERVTAY